MKAVITTLLLLGTSTFALADSPAYDSRSPSYESRYDRGYDARYGGRFDGHGDRFDQRAWSRRPVLLAQNVSLFRPWNHQQRPLLVNLDARARGLNKLGIASTTGGMHVSAVVINFADGHQQTVRLNQSLSPRQSSIFIDLDHRGATSMYVYGTPMRGSRATFDVIGSRR
jgi:hypothetical protein